MYDLAKTPWEGVDRFSSLKDYHRRELRQRCEAIKRVRESSKKGEAIHAEAKALGVGESTVRLWITKFENSGCDWTSIIDKRKEPHWDQRVPVAFLQFWEHLCELSGGNLREAHKVLRRLYISRRAHFHSKVSWGSVRLWPGYKSRPQPSGSAEGLPRGWGYANLARLLKVRAKKSSAPSSFESALKRVRTDDLVKKLDTIAATIESLRADALKGKI